MKIKQKVLQLTFAALLVLGVSFVVATPTFAAEKCGNIDTSIIKCKQDGSGALEQTGAWGLLLLAINILTAGIGIAAIGGIVYGSVLYTSAGGSPEQVKKAMGIITNVVIGVIAYALMWSGLNFIIPGGLFT